MRSDLLGAAHLDYEKALTEAEKNTCADLELEPVIRYMAEGEAERETAVRSVLLQPSFDEETLKNRQAAVRDACLHPETVRFLYDCAGRILGEEQKGFWREFDCLPDRAVRRAVSNLKLFLGGLEEMRSHPMERPLSPAFQNFYRELDRVLAPDRIRQMEELNRQLLFSGGQQVICTLSEKGISCPKVLLPDESGGMGKMMHCLGLSLKGSRYSFSVEENDEAGLRNLSDFLNQAQYDSACELAKISTSWRTLFRRIRAEAGFLLGAVRLRSLIPEQDSCYPVFGRTVSMEKIKFIPAILEKKERKPITVSFPAGLLILTGIHGGGKTEFLKLFGQSELLALAGLFLPAASACLPVYDRVLTHWRREEDDSLEMGKLAEEMERFGRMLDETSPRTLVLFNESFASTGEEEGSRIAMGVAEGLTDAGTDAAFVTHQYEFAGQMYRKGKGTFLSPTLDEEGRPDFALRRCEPQKHTAGMKLFEEVFGEK